MPTGVESEKAALFDLRRAYRDNNPAKRCACGNWHPNSPASSSAPLKANGQSSKTIVEECEAEWRADQKAMMKRDMAEDSYVEQCSVKDDVPFIPSEPNPNAAPPAAPK